MELRQLKYFAATAETLNFSEAAKNLCVAQSTLSQQIRQLEEELDIRLFDRTNHGITLTEAGREVLPAVLRTIHDAEICTESIRDLRGLRTGTLRIGVTYSFSPILNETLLEFMKLYPAITVKIYYKPMAELMEMLEKRNVDFVLAYRPLRQHPEVESHILFQTSLAAVMSATHSLANRETLAPADLQTCQLALPSAGLQARAAFDTLVPDAASFNIRVEVNDVNFLLTLVGNSNLVTILADGSVPSSSPLRSIPLDLPLNEMTGCVHLLKNTYHKFSMKEFIRLLTASLAVRRRQTAWL